MKLSVMTMILLAACAGANGTPNEAASAAPWRIEMTSSGGFAGRGAGNYTLDSSGALAMTTMNGRACTFQLEPAEVARFASLLDAAHPADWKPSYAPEDRCCDRIEYQLKVNFEGKDHATEWIDDPLPMPEGLTKLWMAMTGGVDSLRLKYDPQCK